jgi:hypothetical protein
MGAVEPDRSEVLGEGKGCVFPSRWKASADIGEEHSVVRDPTIINQ